MGPGWGGGLRLEGERVLEMSGGRTTFSVIFMVSPKPVEYMAEEDPELFHRFSQRTVYLPPTGHLRVRFKNEMWTAPNIFQSSLRALSILFCESVIKECTYCLVIHEEQFQDGLPKSRQKRKVSETGR